MILRPIFFLLSLGLLSTACKKNNMEPLPVLSCEESNAHITVSVQRFIGETRVNTHISGAFTREMITTARLIE